MAGLPGLGLGGIFYVILIAWAAMRELFLWLRGRSTATRRKQVADLVVLAVAVVAAMWGAGLLMRQAVVIEALNTEQVRAFEALLPTAALTPFLILTGLLLAVRLVGEWRARSLMHRQR